MVRPILTPLVLAMTALNPVIAAPAPEIPPAATAAWVESLGVAAAPLRSAIPAAERALEVIRLAAVPSAGDAPSGWARGATLARYAAAETADPRRLESTRDYARRTLAGKPADRITVDDLIARLRADAALITTACDEAARNATGAGIPVVIADLRVIARLAEFHGLRLKAAVHYNLFLRAQRLAELVAATYVEKEAVNVWRGLVAATVAAARHGTRARPLHLRSDWAADLARLEESARDLEAQCCPPAPELLRERTWEPAAPKSLDAPRVEILRTGGRGERVLLRLSMPARFTRVFLLTRAPGESVFRETPAAVTAEGDGEAELPSSAGRLEGYVASQGPEGTHFFPAPWDRPSLLAISGR
ncbi:MAG: hypothetical protein ACKOTF_01820 [Opitutaceae bacterium]